MKKRVKNILLYMFIGICIVGILKYINYKNPFSFRIASKIKEKEDAYQFVLDNQKELENIMGKLEGLYDEKGEKWIYIRSDTYTKYQFSSADEIIRKYPIGSIGIRETWENNSHFYISFRSAPQGYEYSGIYYSVCGKPITWNYEEKYQWQKAGDTYIEYSPSYRYETEQIVDKWYYYQCVF